MSSLSPLPYLLITPAHNEEKHIEKTIQSMIRQTVLPVRWIIVNDGSTDATGTIIAQYAKDHLWIEVLELPRHRDRSFAGKVHAFKAGLKCAIGLDYEIIGNVDGDLSFEPDYCEFLVTKFREDPRLGVAGTIFVEDGYSSATDSFEGHNHVAGGCQLFRRECFEEVGGYVPNRAGGIDWIAVSTARMKGWKTRSFREKAFFHHRTLGTAERGILASNFSYGEKDYYLGGHPLWELFRVAYRITKKPYGVGAAAVGLGYLSALLRRMHRPVSVELMRFHRGEQMAKLWAIVKKLFSLKRVDSFEVTQ